LYPWELLCIYVVKIHLQRHPLAQYNNINCLYIRTSALYQNQQNCSNMSCTYVDTGKYGRIRRRII
jgi:hypothetical protein